MQGEVAPASEPFSGSIRTVLMQISALTEESVQSMHAGAQRPKTEKSQRSGILARLQGLDVPHFRLHLCGDRSGTGALAFVDFLLCIPQVAAIKQEEQFSTAANARDPL